MANAHRDPRQSIVRDVLLYPVDGRGPRITQMSFSEFGAKTNPNPALYTLNVDLTSLYGPENMPGACAKLWDVDGSESPDEKYVLYHNIGPDLPVNVALARLLKLEPNGLHTRLLWRGDVVIVKRRNWPASLAVGNGPHMEYVDIPRRAIELFNSRLIPEWYRSEEWKSFHQEQLDLSKSGGWWLRQWSWPFAAQLYSESEDPFSTFLSGRATDCQKIQDAKAGMLNELMAHTCPRDPQDTVVVRDVLLYPANGSQPRVIRMPLFPPIVDLHPSFIRVPLFSLGPVDIHPICSRRVSLGYTTGMLFIITSAPNSPLIWRWPESSTLIQTHQIGGRCGEEM
ncbi:hypothetical protein C8R45DRAFT_986045 [Mycena sanguinolenta]|nr:hypothetical protein C8R45DRAFT_986045 [Mycena sanguinolenta]